MARCVTSGREGLSHEALVSAQMRHATPIACSVPRMA
jgi:hypothetical protein